MQKVRKAVVLAAGLGTRFLPQTKAMPKEMLPVVDKPVIQIVVEELVEAGIEDIIIVTGYSKRNIEDHFDRPTTDLSEMLINGGEKKKKLLDEVNRISNLANFVYVRQKGPYGNGTPLLNVRHLVQDEPFIYTWADDFIVAKPNSRFQQLIAMNQKYDCTCLSCVRAITDADYDRYGFAGGEEVEDGVIDAKVVVEKPGKEKAPSNLATVCGGLLMPHVFDYIDRALEERPEMAELYWNDPVKMMMADGKRVMAVDIKNGKYFDTGNKLEYMKTVVEFALKHEEIGAEFSEWIKTV